MNADAPPSFRPPPNASSLQQRHWERQMQLWLRDKLNEELNQDLMRANRDAKRTWEDMCIMQARSGDPEPLRKLYPQFEDCIFSPKLRRGKRYPNKTKWKFDPAKSAAQFARLIRAHWRVQYGQQNRTRDEKSAEDFAVNILKEWFPTEAAGLTVNKVLARKPSGKYKPRRK